MSSTKIKSIKIKDNGSVYLNSSFNPSLTDVYHNEGEDGLNRELVQMFWEYAKPFGYHESLLPFIYLIRNKSKETEKIYSETTEFLNEQYKVLDSKEYDELSKKSFKEMYSKFAEMTKEMPKEKYNFIRDNYIII